MKKILAVFSAFLVLCSLFSVCTFAAGTNYYIDSINGNDTNGGTAPDAAWKTVANLAQLTLGAGDSLLFCRGGVYDCNITLTCSGTAQAPVTVCAYGTGAKPLLTTNQKTEVIRLYDCSYVTVKDLEITAPNGGGIWVDTLQKESRGVTLTGLTMHNMQNVKQKGRDNLSAGAAVARACVMVKGLPARSRYAVQDFTVTNCEMYDCGNGISLWGSWNDAQNPHCETEAEIDPVYNENTLVKNVYFHDMTAEAVIVGMSKNALVTDCRCVNCCQDEGTDENGNVKFYNAAMWFWGSEYSTIQRCEIAGQKCVGDGMAVDFDSHSNHCTYQYIYSHNNVRFMCNCPNYSGQHGNTVRYCLSVNDNGGRSRFAGDEGEYEFRFYNNTVVNCGDFYFLNIYNSFICNNIIAPVQGASMAYEFGRAKNNTFKNNCYYNCFAPVGDPFARNILPGFSGTDLNDPASFTLCADSPLIGAGTQINDGLTADFFGNNIVQSNIGCYGGGGSNTRYTREWLPQKLLRYVRTLIAVLRAEVNK